MTQKDAKKLYKHLCKSIYIMEKEKKRAIKDGDVRGQEAYDNASFQISKMLLHFLNGTVIKDNINILITEKEEVYMVIRFLKDSSLGARTKYTLDECITSSNKKLYRKFAKAFYSEDKELMKKLYKEVFESE